MRLQLAILESPCFDGDQPIRLDVSTPIVECLKITTEPADRSMPAPRIDGSALLIGPCLIGKRQTTVFSLLLDGPEPRLRKPEQTLVDVYIQNRDPDAPVNPWLPWLLGLILVVGVVAGVAYYLLAVPNP